MLILTNDAKAVRCTASIVHIGKRRQCAHDAGHVGLHAWLDWYSYLEEPVLREFAGKAAKR